MIFAIHQTLIHGICGQAVNDVAVDAKSLNIALVKWASGFSRHAIWTTLIIDFITIFQKFTNLAVWIVSVPLTVWFFLTLFQAGSVKT